MIDKDTLVEMIRDLGPDSRGKYSYKLFDRAKNMTYHVEGISIKREHLRNNTYDFKIMNNLIDDNFKDIDLLVRYMEYPYMSKSIECSKLTDPNCEIQFFCRNIRREYHFKSLGL